jgi:hypothetical protein
MLQCNVTMLRNESRAATRRAMVAGGPELEVRQCHETGLFWTHRAISALVIVSPSLTNHLYLAAVGSPCMSPSIYTPPDRIKRSNFNRKTENVALIRNTMTIEIYNLDVNIPCLQVVWS